MGNGRSQDGSRRPRVPRRVLVGVGGTVLFLVAAKLWVAPAVVKNRIAVHVGRVCNGKVRVRQARVGFGGQVAVGTLVVEDPRGRPWIQASHLRLRLGGGADFDLYVSKMAVGSLEVDLYREQPEPWFTEARPASDEDRRLDVVVERIVVRAHDGDASAAWIDGARLKATRARRVYEGSFSDGSGPAGTRTDITGTVDPRSTQFQLQGRLDRMLDANQVSVLLAWADVPADYGGQGRLEARGRVSGSWRELADLKMNGRLHVADATVSYKGAPVVSGLDLTSDVNDTHWHGQFKGRMLEGTLRGALDLEHKGLTVARGQVSLEAEQVNLGGLAANVPDWGSFTQGMAFGHYDAAFERPTLPDVNGAGALYIAGMDVHLVPVVSQILAALGILGADTLGVADAMIWFDNRGPVVTVNDGSVADAVSAIKAEPGGQVNLKERTVDLHAVWVPLKQVEGLLASLPLVNLLTDLKDKLIRVHVQGTWDQPASELVSKEPVEDISEGLADFIKSVAKTGGQIPKAMFDALGSIGKQR